MSEASIISNWPYCDSSAPLAITGEKDACGVGFLAHIKGKSSHWVLEQALRGLNCMEHRGGCGGDSDSGDGAGILCAIPWNYLRSIWKAAETIRKESTGLGMIFMPQDNELRKEAQNFASERLSLLALNP